MGGSTTHACTGQLIIRTGEVRRTTVTQSSVALVWHVRIRVHISDIARSAGSRETEVITLLNRAKIIQISTATVECELCALLSDNVEIVTSCSRRRASTALLRWQRTDVRPCRTTSVHDAASRIHRRTFVGGRTDLGGRTDHQLTEFIPFGSTARWAAADATVALAIVAGGEVV